MKKLLFAIAGAAAFSAFAADPAAGANDISIVGFENYTADQTVIGYGDNGVSGNSLWTCAGDDASLVKTYAGGDIAAPNIKEPAPFDGAAENAKYLALDTNGSELQRAIGTSVAADGTYIDTLVQFTPSESAPSAEDLSGAKLAIWLGVENNVTNLMVQGNYWDFDSAPTATAQAYALTGKTIEPGTWYRLTVKAIPNILGQGSGMSLPAFQIVVDGTEMVLAASPLSDDFLDILEQSSMYATADIQTAVTANKLVPSIQAEIGTYGDTVTLASVGFKGTGALDDFVVTTEDPTFAPATLDFTLTWDSTKVSAVSYVLSTDLATTNTLTSGTAVQIAAGTAGTVELIPTFEAGYEFDKLLIDTTNEWPSLTFPVPPVSVAGELVAKASAPAYPTYLADADADVKAKYDTWAGANGADTASAYEKQFLLNAAPATVVPDTALAITAIEQNATAGWDITVECTVSGVDLSGTVGTAKAGNGYLAVSYTDDLGGTWTTENIAITASANGKVTVNVNKSNAKFMKVKLSATAEPQN